MFVIGIVLIVLYGLYLAHKKDKDNQREMVDARRQIIRETTWEEMERVNFITSIEL